MVVTTFSHQLRPNKVTLWSAIVCSQPAEVSGVIFKFWYLDYVVIIGERTVIAKVFECIFKRGLDYGLILNPTNVKYILTYYYW